VIRKRVFILIVCFYSILYSVQMVEADELLENKIRAVVHDFIVKHQNADSLSIRIDLPELTDSDIKDPEDLQIIIDWKKGYHDLKGRVYIPAPVLTNEQKVSKSCKTDNYLSVFGGAGSFVNGFSPAVAKRQRWSRNPHV